MHSETYRKMPSWAVRLLISSVVAANSVKLVCSSCCQHPRLVRHPASSTPNSSSVMTNVTTIPNVQGPYQGYVAISTAPFSIRIPEHGLKRTSHQAAVGCAVASNGGPFQSDGEPVGPVIIESRIVHSDFPKDAVGFGRTTGNEWILGTLKDASEALEFHVESFLGGFNWLVYNGSISIPDVNPTGAERAPRTMIGVTVDGNVLVAAVDGCEKW